MNSCSRKIRHVSGNCILSKSIVWLWISFILVTAVSSLDKFDTNGHFGNRKDSFSMPHFISGSRFGRSESRSTGKSSNVESPFLSGSRFGRSEVFNAGKNSKELPKLFGIVPRVDHFFYGSRYGKRSSPMQELQRAPPKATLNYARFEAAIDYLDRVKQDFVETNEYEDETKNISREQGELDTAVYSNPYAGRNKI